MYVIIYNPQIVMDEFAFYNSQQEQKTEFIFNNAQQVYVPDQNSGSYPNGQVN